MFLPPDEPVDDRAPGDVIDDSHEEVARLRARIEAAFKACGEAVDEASKPRQKHSTGLAPPIGRDRSEWDDGYKNGVQACATVAWAALTHRRV